jgi:hypothetical protein
MKKAIQPEDNDPTVGEPVAQALSRPISRRTLLKGALASAPLLISPTLLLPRKAAAASNIGPSTTTEPYLVPTIPGVKFVSILTVGDSIGGYRMVGIPDGLGAFLSGRGLFTLLMNHEITNGANVSGIQRAHGSNGAFVSRWTIDQRTLKVLKGQDLTPSSQHVFLWDSIHEEYTQGSTQWQRLCSADLPAESALFGNGRGTRERIFFDGEEVNEGRAWARVVTGPHAGEAWQLPRLGRMAYENAVACPHSKDKTVVLLTDDGDLNTAPSTTGFPSEVYVYIGEKAKSGHPIEQAGLTDGDFYGVKVSVNGTPVDEESDLFGLGVTATGFIGKGKFTLVNLGDVSNLTPRQIEDISIANGLTRFRRPEDCAWDPRKGEKHRNDAYFVTTADINTNCRLWRLRFDDVKEHPENGGTIEILLTGSEGHRMLDNVTIDPFGRIVMDEDPGNQGRVSKIWLYQIATGEFIELAHHNPKFFDPTILNNSSFITQDDESSGIVDASDILGDGWFLLDSQAHKVNTGDPELVEGGQLLCMFIDPSIGAGKRGKKNDEDEE